MAGAFREEEVAEQIGERREISTNAPFRTRVLGGDDEHDGTAVSVAAKREFSDYLPATRRTKEDHITIPQFDADFLETELHPYKLNDVQDWLWLCGRPMPPRPLHYQTVLKRDIVITEDIDLHLVWGKSGIFIKPLPGYLLEPEFWATHLQPGQATATRPPLKHHATSHLSYHGQHLTPATMTDIAACARGLIFSYTALVQHRSDFEIAKANKLLPSEITWLNWRLFCAEVISSSSIYPYASLNPRYWYGELRLSRLNKVYKVARARPLRGFSRVAAHAVYADLLSDNFAALAGFLGYVVIVLTAMQVGLATQALNGNDAFQQVSYGFTVFAIIGPLAAVFAILAAFIVLFISNWGSSKRYEKKRFGDMGVERYWAREKKNQKTGKQDEKKPQKTVEPSEPVWVSYYNDEGAGTNTATSAA